MNTETAQANLEAAVAHRTALVKAAEATTGARKIAAAWRLVEQADQAVKFATSDVEWAERTQAATAR